MTEDVTLFAAGSLRAALTALLAEFLPAAAVQFGPAGLLRERIAAGDVPDLFLSANMDHPRALAAGRRVQAFAANALVAVARRELGLTEENFLATLLRDGVSIGTSTPVLDPSGDYAWQMFAQADALQPGAGALLAGRARPLVGGRDAPPAVPGRYPARDFLESGEVDVFLSYRSNAASMADGFDVVTPPAPLRVRAVYGMVVLATQPARRAAVETFCGRILAPAGQAILARHGFQPVDQAAS